MSEQRAEIPEVSLIELVSTEKNLKIWNHLFSLKTLIYTPSNPALTTAKFTFLSA